VTLKRGTDYQLRRIELSQMIIGCGRYENDSAFLLSRAPKSRAQPKDLRLYCLMLDLRRRARVPDAHSHRFRVTFALTCWQGQRLPTM